jgi:mono/diheme cytochrome c family protein
MSTPQPREFSHPVLWTVGMAAAAILLTWVFAHWFGRGARHGRDEGAAKFAPAVVAKPIDHPALIADRSPAVLERGQVVYLKNCASCHGASGDQNLTGSNPAPRNLKTEAFKAEWGGGPYGLYLTLTKGWGQGMPGFTNLEAADRYAVAHFVRESWIKGSDRYLANDADPIAKQIPQPGGAVADGPRIEPSLVEQPIHLHPLMQVVADESTQATTEALAWIQASIPLAEPAERPLLSRIALVGARRSGWLQDVRAAAQSGDQARTAQVLGAAGSGDPSFALMPSASMEAAAAVLVRTATPRS